MMENSPFLSLFQEGKLVVQLEWEPPADCGGAPVASYEAGVAFHKGFRTSRCPGGASGGRTGRPQTQRIQFTCFLEGLMMFDAADHLHLSCSKLVCRQIIRDGTVIDIFDARALENWHQVCLETCHFGTEGMSVLDIVNYLTYLILAARD